MVKLIRVFEYVNERNFIYWCWYVIGIVILESNWELFCEVGCGYL